MRKNPLACAAGLASARRVIEKEQLPARSASPRQGRKACLERAKMQPSPRFAAGLLIGVELRTRRRAQDLPAGALHCCVGGSPSRSAGQGPVLASP